MLKKSNIFQPHGMVKSWPKSERPREKLLHRGAESLSDAELLAIFFTHWGTRLSRCRSSQTIIK
jgi:DNA repair protein RadC